jgi:hypothetical protein
LSGASSCHPSEIVSQLGVALRQRDRPRHCIQFISVVIFLNRRTMW